MILIDKGPMTNAIKKRNLLAVRATKALAGIFLFPFFRVQTSGSENISENGSFVLLVKHQRWEDIPLLGLSVKRELYYVAKSELFANPISRCYISSIGGVPLDRKNPARSHSSIGLITEFLRDGEGIVIFPEGTYFKGHMGPIRVGLIKHIISSVPAIFIPVGFEYSGRRWRRSVQIRIGKPIRGEGINDLNRLVDYAGREISRLSGLDL
ncbi:MAG: 1-acyl-sn-glycerol-3-phosphate acyltransferase [Deltaproteobacteria bacterium]|nr:1-acyl-sn-glycerol-3-phosphate acyltransferase [Deltaproteobacteria bacterium]